MIVVPSVQIAWVKKIGINDKKRDRYEQEIVIDVVLICRGV